MKELTEIWGARLLGFALELPGGYARFPRHLLGLLSKYFSCHKLLFFPYVNPDGHEEFYNLRDALGNFSALNMDMKAMREYTRHFYKTDVFSRRNLPEALKKQKVVLLEDIMPLSVFEKTEYYKDFFANYNLLYQACIFLKINNQNVAAINVYRSPQEGCFTEADRMLFAYLSDFISSHYATAFNSATNMVVQNAFNLFFSKLDIGVALLNQQLIVLKANKPANEFSKILLDSAGLQGVSFQRSVYSMEEGNHYVQQVVNNIGLELNGDDGVFVQSRTVGEFVLYHNSFLFTNLYGNVETRHFLFIIHNKRPSSRAVNSNFEKLTQREAEILNYVTHGYSNEKICDLLHVSIFTVRTHISNIYKKFGVNSKVELLLKLNQTDEG